MRKLALALMLMLICGINTCYTGVQSFGLLKVGDKAFFKLGDQAAHPYMFIHSSNFYVYVIAQKVPIVCVFDDCGVNGALVEHLGGWITGDSSWVGAEQLNVTIADVQQGKVSMILLADKHLRLVGIYPYRTTHDLLDLLAEHPGILGL